MDSRISIEGKTVELNSLGSPLYVNLRRSLKAKNISIRINGRKVELVIPYKGAAKSACEFLFSKEKWIRAKLKDKKDAPEKHEIIHSEYSVLNNIYKLRHVNMRTGGTACIEGNHIIVCAPQDELHETLTNFFKKRVLTEINIIALSLAQEYKFAYNKIQVKELRNKWGSCSSLKNLVFNWRIIFAPTPVLHYLVAHELCHLREMNHGEKFWKLVATIAPDYKAARKWLKEEGYKLYHYLPVALSKGSFKME